MVVVGMGECKGVCVVGVCLCDGCVWCVRGVCVFVCVVWCVCLVCV